MGKISSFQILICKINNFINLANLIVINLSKDDNVMVIILVFYVICVSAVYQVLLGKVLIFILSHFVLISTIIDSASNHLSLLILIFIIILIILIIIIV